jgi:uncharacterized OsmC-like protein
MTPVTPTVAIAANDRKLQHKFRHSTQKEHVKLSYQTNSEVAQGKPIVSKIDEFPAPASFQIEPAKKTKDGLELEVHVLAELVPGSGLMKRCYVKPNVPSFGAFELYCDEGSMIGGSDSAPAPLSYLAAGIAFCLLTHLKAYIDTQKIDVSSVRLEQRMKFQSRIPGMTAEAGGQMEGHANGLETCIFVETNEPPSVVARMVEVAQQACMATQALVNVVPVNTTVIRGGEKI